MRLWSPRRFQLRGYLNPHDRAGDRPTTTTPTGRPPTYGLAAQLGPRLGEKLPDGCGSAIESGRALELGHREVGMMGREVVGAEHHPGLRVGRLELGGLDELGTTGRLIAQRRVDRRE